MKANRMPIVSLLPLALIFWSPFALASGASKKAHEHGVAQLNLAAEGNSVTIQFESPADEIYGFEHAPKSPAEKEKQQAALELLKSKASEIIGFDATLGCSFKETTANVVMDGPKHSEVRATFKVECSKPLKGATVNVGFAKYFPSIKTIKMQILSDGKQDGKVLKKSEAVIL
jgi:hypothetical protein